MATKIKILPSDINEKENNSSGGFNNCLYLKKSFGSRQKN